VLTIVVVIDSPHAGGRSGGVVSAPVFRRIAESAVRYLGIPPTVNPDPPVLVARHEADAPLSNAASASGPIVNLVADGPAGTVPDVRGMSAREAMRKLVKVGLAARLTGDGFVVSQDPAPGTPIDDVDVCRLTLARSPRALAGAQ
jgi:cell division protein FtsI (penicillin-binding protein 3)